MIKCVGKYIETLRAPVSRVYRASAITSIREFTSNVFGTADEYGPR